MFDNHKALFGNILEKFAELRGIKPGRSSGLVRAFAFRYLPANGTAADSALEYPASLIGAEAKAFHPLRVIARREQHYARRVEGAVAFIEAG